ncbi:hypothetical protein [Ensifer sp. B1-9]|uniref:hypothetical protein n=1 Tax=Ensifer sp. B1-9 TaxID=3141455 RepID=UPI003D1B3A0A
MENPYWHDQFKPHQTDRVEIRLLCFEIASIVEASASRQGSGITYEEGERPDVTILDELHFRLAESELSKRLLRLALLVRTFDDTMERSEGGEEYREHRKKIESELVFGTVFEGPERITETVRECSNKIIHAEDVRPVYDSDDDRNDPNARWGMDGTIELQGMQGQNTWMVVLYLHSYLEGVLQLVRFGEP